MRKASFSEAIEEKDPNDAKRFVGDGVVMIMPTSFYQEHKRRRGRCCRSKSRNKHPDQTPIPINIKLDVSLKSFNDSKQMDSENVPFVLGGSVKNSLPITYETISSTLEPRVLYRNQAICNAQQMNKFPSVGSVEQISRREAMTFPIPAGETVILSVKLDESKILLKSGIKDTNVCSTPLREVPEHYDRNQRSCDDNICTLEPTLVTVGIKQAQDACSPPPPPPPPPPLPPPPIPLEISSESLPHVWQRDYRHVEKATQTVSISTSSQVDKSTQTDLLDTKVEGDQQFISLNKSPQPLYYMTPQSLKQEAPKVPETKRKKRIPWCVKK